FLTHSRAHARDKPCKPCKPCISLLPHGLSLYRVKINALKPCISIKKLSLQNRQLLQKLRLVVSQLISQRPILIWLPGIRLYEGICLHTCANLYPPPGLRQP